MLERVHRRGLLGMLLTGFLVAGPLGCGGPGATQTAPVPNDGSTPGRPGGGPAAEPTAKAPARR